MIMIKSIIVFCTNYNLFAISNVLKQTGIATANNYVQDIKISVKNGNNPLSTFIEAIF